MKRTSLILALALLATRVIAADAPPTQDDACRKNLRQLATGIETYRLLFEKNPAKLSDLFTEGLVDDLRLFVCPASPTKTIFAAEIDAKSDYVLGENGKDLVHERAKFHANDETLAIFADGTISVVGGTVATTTTTSPTTTTTPTKPATPETPKPRRSMKEILAAERGDTPEVRALVAGSDPNARDEFVQRTALAWSIVLYDRNAFARLLAAPGADINSVDGRNETPLLIAAASAMQFDMTPVAEALIAKGASVGGEGHGMSALMLAANSNAPGIVRAILSRLPTTEIDARNSDGMTALIVGASVGAAEVVRQLLERGAAIDGTDKLGMTPLMHAAGHVFPQTVATVKILLEKGANPNARDSDGNTPLSAATARGSAEVVALLRKAGAR